MMDLDIGLILAKVFLALALLLWLSSRLSDIERRLDAIDAANEQIMRGINTAIGVAAAGKNNQTRENKTNDQN